MSQYVTNIDLSSIEMDRRNQSEFIAPNVEHDPVADLVGSWKRCPQLAEVLKIRLLHDFEPPDERRFTVRMLGPKLLQGFARDNVHDPIISQNEIQRNDPTSCEMGKL